MTRHEQLRARLMAALVSVAVHLSLAALVIWTGASVLPTSRPAKSPAIGASRSAGTAVAGPTARTTPLPVSVVVKAVAGDLGDAIARVPLGWAIASRVLQPPIETGSRESSLVLTHLWQSTLFAGAIALLTLAFRRNRAGVRYGLWFVASMKFLVPIALLTTLGSQVPLGRSVETTPAAELRLAPTMARANPLDPQSSAHSAGDAAGARAWMRPLALWGWSCGCLALALTRLTMWRRIRATVRASTPLRLPELRTTGLDVRSAAGVMEPGVVGWLRPVLLLPTGIERTLTRQQFEAVLTHERCHIRRKDNLTAAVHMVTETLFWFHPLVWWIGARLVDERERACDESVLLSGHRPGVYADGILAVCKAYLESPLACVSGVSGADLRTRIEAIMRNQIADTLSMGRQVSLAALGSLAVVLPVAFGMLTTPRLVAQSSTAIAGGPAFETASVKPNKSNDPIQRLEPQPGGRINAVNVSVIRLIGYAYDLPLFQLAGGPDWIRSDRFDVAAKAIDDAPLPQKRLMLRQLLADRFTLVAHTEMREQPIYRLVMARSDGRPGPQLRPSASACGPRELSPLDNGVGFNPSAPVPTCNYFGFAPGTVMAAGHGGLAFRGMTMPELAKVVVTMVRRQVKDETGLTGDFDGDFDFMSELPPPPPPPGLPNPWGNELISVFTVFPEQLGLKLESGRGPVETLVIDSVRPLTPQ